MSTMLGNGNDCSATEEEDIDHATKRFLKRVWRKRKWLTRSLNRGLERDDVVDLKRPPAAPVTQDEACRAIKGAPQGGRNPPLASPLKNPTNAGRSVRGDWPSKPGRTGLTWRDKSEDETPYGRPGKPWRRMLSGA